MGAVNHQGILVLGVLLPEKTGHYRQGGTANEPTWREKEIRGAISIPDSLKSV